MFLISADDSDELNIRTSLELYIKDCLPSNFWPVNLKLQDRPFYLMTSQILPYKSNN